MINQNYTDRNENMNILFESLFELILQKTAKNGIK